MQRWYCYPSTVSMSLVPKQHIHAPFFKPLFSCLTLSLLLSTLLLCSQSIIFSVLTGGSVFFCPHWWRQNIFLSSLVAQKYFSVLTGGAKIFFRPHWWHQNIFLSSLVAPKKFSVLTGGAIFFCPHWSLPLDTGQFFSVHTPYFSVLTGGAKIFFCPHWSRHIFRPSAQGTGVTKGYAIARTSKLFAALTQ